MNIRQISENNEKNILSSRACLSVNSLGRSVFEEDDDVRTCFQRDRDRIIHSGAFRCLKHKTQVFLAPKGDYYRTRLTHTLEVAQIARTISRALALNEDLTEAIALGHDLGHTPFGHAGERTLNELNPYGFKHYEQSVRIVEYIEKEGRGLNLTAEVKDGMLCHTAGKNAYTLEGQVVRLADKIAYVNHDIDDAVRAGVISESDIPSELTSKLGIRKSKRINSLVLDVIENSDDTIKMSSECNELFTQLHQYIYHSVYKSEFCKNEDEKASAMLEQLYKYFYNHTDKLPDFYRRIAKATDKDTAICDYISGMSDNYSVKVYNKIFIPKFSL